MAAPDVGYGAVMATYQVNTDARRKAEQMIDSGQYDLHTDWSDGSPTADDGNEVIDRHGYEGYGAWHLGIDTDASEDTKDRFGFPFGDFTRVYRSALIHAKQRAAQNDHDDVEAAAGELLEKLDAQRA